MKEVTIMKEVIKNEKEATTMDEIIKSAKNSHDEYQAKLKQIVSKLNNLFLDLTFIQFIDNFDGSHITLDFDCADDNTIIVSVKDV